MIVVELIFLATMGFFLLASETVRINAVLRSQINKDQKELDKVEAQNNALQNGTDNGTIIGQLGGGETPVKTTKDDQGNEKIDSIADLDHRILIATRLRGRIWRNVTPAGAPNAQTGAVNVKVPAPTPAGIKKETRCFRVRRWPDSAAGRERCAARPAISGRIHRRLGRAAASLAPAGAGTG